MPPASASSTLTAQVQRSILDLIEADGLEEPALTDDPRTVDFGDATVFPVVSASDLNSATKSVDPPDDGPPESVVRSYLEKAGLRPGGAQ